MANVCFTDKSAVMSPCGTYRYQLRRAWVPQVTPDNKPVLWVLLNPSTADAWRDDPTVRKAAGFSSKWGYQQMVLVNLYALRATDPRYLTRVDYDIVGAMSDERIIHWTGQVNKVVVAWGKNPVKHSKRHERVLEMLHARHEAVYCLGTNQDGHPKHPLMLSYDTPLVEYLYDPNR